MTDASGSRSAPVQRHVVISLGSLRSLQDGLGEFSLQIGSRLAAGMQPWLAAHGVRLSIHLQRELFGLFGDQAHYIAVSRWQRLWHRTRPPCTLWHSLHQVNKVRAPREAEHRIVTVHDLNYLYDDKPGVRQRGQRFALKLMRQTDHVVAISHYTANDVQQHLHWQGPLQVIHNGARSFVNSPQEPLPGWPQTGARPFLFHLSRMSASKNPQAILALARAWPEMTFVLSGPPSQEAQALQATEHLPNLQFHLGISDAQKAWAYAHCAGFLFPSLAEGFGLPPIEAMHFGKPVFLARRSCLPEIGGEVAHYFDHFEPLAMKAVVQKGLLLHQRPGAEAAVQAHAAQFDWDRAAKAYLALYARLLRLPEPWHSAAAPDAGLTPPIIPA